MIKMKLKKKRLYNPNFPNQLEVNHYQLKQDAKHTFQKIKRTKYAPNVYLNPLLKVNKQRLSAREQQIQQIAEYILKMKAKGLRYSIQPEEL